MFIRKLLLFKFGKLCVFVKEWAIIILKRKEKKKRMGYIVRKLYVIIFYISLCLFVIRNLESLRLPKNS